ncbi:MAG: MarC family protein [Hyphomicrobiales bacterium]|nr:MarC family protein [Hyphomicrobiales bacterium]MBV8662975.1 MarC family protein [Hyphomicrobiales bacterium]
MARAACLAIAGVMAVAHSTAALADAPFGAAQGAPISQELTFFFLMLGPFKVVAPFLSVTQGLDPADARKIAWLATLFSSLALAAAGLLGEGLLANYGIPLPILALAGGIILFVVALRNMLQQFNPAASRVAPRGERAAGKPDLLATAITPVAFPAIVTPYGVAALVVFLALSPDMAGRLTIAGLVAAIMALNLIVMLSARRVLSVMAVVLPILGAVLGVVQIALGLKIIYTSLRALLST